MNFLRKVRKRNFPKLQIQQVHIAGKRNQHFHVTLHLQSAFFNETNALCLLLCETGIIMELKKTSLSFTDIMAAYSWLLILVLR